MDERVPVSINDSDCERTPIVRIENAELETRNKRPMQRESSEGELGRRVRQPVQYQAINNGNIESDDHTSAVLSRYKYYSRLAPHSDSSFQMPDHIVPTNFYSVIPTVAEGKQSSLITIFSLWNTMMGTSILSMPWAIRQAGFATGITLLVLMAVLMLYTSYRILKSMQSFGSVGGVLDFSDVCYRYLGRWAQVLAVTSSLLTLLGGAIVYWILMSNFMYNVVTFIYHQTSDTDHNSTQSHDYVCSALSSSTNDTNHSHVGQLYLQTRHHSHDDLFDRIWDEQYTVPFFLVAVLGPLINFKSPTFFTKFNALGTVSVTYLVSFVAVNAVKWGFHLPLNAEQGDDINHIYIPEFRGTFVALTGVAALAYFVQNCVISICRNQKNPENNIRDLIIAYCLVAATYIYMGTMFYSIFPLNKECIEDNLLNNLADTNVLAFVARIGLFFQMMCVFPLLLYIFRVQILHSLFGSVWPSLKHVLILNLIIVAICILFAVFVPHIGKIIGFVGAFCGFSYAILLPCLVYLKTRHINGTLSYPVVFFHSFLILLGLGNFVGQFVIL